MGCDIHIYTEKKDREGNWNCVDFFVPNTMFGKYEDEIKEFEIKEFYHDRDYELFGALAGVRGEIPHIDQKGFPEDASERLKNLNKDYGCDGHSHSYLTLGELKEHQNSLGNTIKRSGVISLQQAEDLEKGIKPNGWCQGTSDKTWVRRDWTATHNPMDFFMGQLQTFLGFRFWNYEVRDMNDEDFRVVFWFDN